MDNISDHITYEEAIRSRTAREEGIDNTPSESHLKNMRLIAERIFEPTRKALGGYRIRVTSFFRSIKLNLKLKKASKRSRHTTGQAMDLDAAYYGHSTNKEMFEFIRNNLEFDKLIWEYGTDEEPEWVHVSYVEGLNRGIVLRAKYDIKEKKTKYTLI